MSDPIAIATVLSKRFDYRNTTLDRKPQFDIMNPAASDYASYDFIVASEVFEHVCPPVQTAFDNLARLLKPGGFVVFSTPWELKGDTLEHFPDLYDWQLVKLRSGYVLINRTPDAHLEIFEDLTFHDGPGSILEMRVFSRSGLSTNCEMAGFGRVDFASDYPPSGIIWDKWSRGLTLRQA